MGLSIGLTMDAAQNNAHQMMKELEPWDKMRFEHLLVDGIKIEANADRYNYVWAKSVRKHEMRLENKLTELLARITLGNGRLLPQRLRNAPRHCLRGRIAKESYW